MQTERIIEAVLAEINRRICLARLGGDLSRDNWDSAAAFAHALGNILEQRAAE